MKITKNELIFYIITLIIIFISGLIIMSIDNMGWVTNSPEWNSNEEVCNQLGCWTGAVKDYSFKEKVDYLLKYRIYTVFTHPIDLFSVGIYSLLITFLIIILRELFKYCPIKKLNKLLYKIK